MILTDTSIWVNHIRLAEPELVARLGAGDVLMHPFVIGELAVGNLRRRGLFLDFLLTLPQPQIASDPDVLRFVEEKKLYGRGISYIDAHLLVSAGFSSARLWTVDRRLQEAAASLGLAFARIQ